MDQTGDPLIPQTPSTRLRWLVSEVLNRYLTVISVAVAVIGLALVIAGPVRAMLNRPAEGGGSGGPWLPGQGLAGVGENDLPVIDEEVVNRQPVPYTIIPDRPRDTVVTYTVKPGDTLFAIANMFGITPNTLFWANSETLGDNVHMLQPGIDLYILPVEGVYHFSDGEHSLQWIADRYNANVEDIINSEYNELSEYTPDDIPPWGMRIVVPGGQREIVDWTPPIVETVDERTGTVIRGFMPGMAGSCPPITGRGGTGVWSRPLSSYTITTPFMTGHSGIDLAAPLGTPVMAADSGVVIFSGWNDWGYGILVVLDHGNGWTSYYGHLSATAVSCGQFVSRGEYIGQVGSTGRSTGPHLHFELRWAHTPDNPALYIGF